MARCNIVDVHFEGIPTNTNKYILHRGLKFCYFLFNTREDILIYIYIYIFNCNGK